MSVEKFVELAAVVALVVVGAGVGVVVKGDIVAGTQKREDWSNGFVDGLARPPRLEAAVVVAVVDEQGRPRRKERGECVVIGDRAEIGRALLLVANVLDATPALPNG